MSGLSQICFCFRTFALVLNMSFEDMHMSNAQSFVFRHSSLPDGHADS